MQDIKSYSYKDIKFKSFNNLEKDLNIMPGYFVKYIPKKGDVVIDCGAYVGCFTIIASKLVGIEGKVIALEPDKVSYRKLLANIELNNLNNVVAINKGAFDKDAKQGFYERTSRGSSFIFESALPKKEVDVIKLDTLQKKQNLRKIDFVKMDVEGSELYALRGAKQVLQNFKPNLAIATYHVVEGKTTDKPVETFLQKLNYKTETGFLQHRVTYGWK